ncbi:MAG: acyltransferase [Cellvibrio sp. 79]|nr:MAG: acyltransferase [Cellvibrio sp. 79]
MPSTGTFSDSKRHYAILDGLRGVAAMMVVVFHMFESHAASRYEQIINHGYLAVDFFFVLSGFVIGYAYDDRWGKMSLTDFFKRRLIRLHPMIVIAMIIGAVMFYFQGGSTFSLVNDTSLWQMLLILLIGITLIPVSPSMDIRGWAEMHPLNGPAWSLFLEYVANILYALFIRKFSNTVLAILVFIAGCTTIHFAVTNPTGDMIGGWSLTAEQLQIGFTRLAYPFLAGLLLSRLIKTVHINNAFFWCSLILIVVFSIPRIGDATTHWMNGLYDALIIIFVFPLVVFIGACGEMKTVISEKICNFLGNISYPIYIIHYPFVYTYTAWVHNNKVSLSEGFPIAIGTIIVCVILAYACLRLYDIPVRKWLTNKLVSSRQP